MIPATPSMHENHAFDQSSAFFWSSSFFALPWAVSHVSVTWIFLRRHSRSSLSLSSFFVFTFAWYLWWGWPNFMKLRSSGVGLNSEQCQCCNLPSCQPFLISNWHFWQMVQMSAQCLLSKTEKAQISGQMQIICTGWHLWLRLPLSMLGTREVPKERMEKLDNIAELLNVFPLKMLAICPVRFRPYRPKSR